jgi:hypothetical protein
MDATFHEMLQKIVYEGGCYKGLLNLRNALYDIIQVS